MLTNLLTAFAALWPIWAAAGLLGFYGYLGARAIRNRERAQRILDARAEENRKTLEYIRSLDERSFEDHPAVRADHARTRRIESGRRMVKADWERPMDGGDAA